jgi:hypothetical protein
MPGATRAQAKALAPMSLVKILIPVELPPAAKARSETDFTSFAGSALTTNTIGMAGGFSCHTDGFGARRHQNRDALVNEIHG